MANSLNQAFIRAYAKERETAHSRAASTKAESMAAEKQVNEDLIQRFDTATVGIPQPHLTTKQPPRERVAASVSSIQPALSTATPVTTGSDSDRELRIRIAGEMLRAGHFQSEQIASLNSLFTFPSATKPARPPATVANQQQPAFAQAQDQSSSAEKVVTEQAPLTESLAPPSLPAPDGTPRAGGILRVDIPSPTTSAPVVRTVAEVPTKKPAAQNSSPRGPQLNHAESMRVDLKHSANDSPVKTHAQQVAEVKQVESKLRSAKVRVFNPVWEVDQLQWPAVCVQLMEARRDSLALVANHLIDACQEGLQVLAVTSPQGGEGRTTVACCLARLAGSRGLKTAIVDGDIENPTLCLQTNLEIEKDWQTALLNHVPLEEIAVHSIDDQITLVPLLTRIDQAELPVDDLRIANMLIELSESFDLVIVDMGHMNSPNGLMISLSEQGIVNAAIAVIDHRTSTSQRIETCIRRIRQAGVHSIGLVENFAA